jgi:hypothetical protein
MERAISNIRSTAVMLPKARPYLLEVGERINDDILAVLPASIAAYVERCLVITPSRIIGVGPDGSVDAWSYADISNVMFRAGKKKLFGHNPSWLFINLADGTNLGCMLHAEYDYNCRVGTLVEEVFRKVRLGQL